MEIFGAKKMTDETLSGVSSISQPNDDSHTILKPTLEETAGGELRSEVVTTTVVETTEVSVVKVIRDDKDDELMKNLEQGKGNEVTKNEKERVFGNLVDGDEGMNVNCSANGEDAGGENLVLPDKNDVEDPMDVCLSVEKQKNDENGAKIFESNNDAKENDEENVENRVDNGRKFAENKDEHADEEDHNFVVGDFVWGKIKSHPWWPGQIYDPSDASDTAARLKHEGRILVAHFGDGSFSWCSSSQLKPFIDYFSEMSNQSDSKKFVNAVQMALAEVSRLVEVGLMCKCQTVNRVDRAGVVNRGIKEGVVARKGNTVKVLMDRLEPGKLLAMLKDCATMDPGAELAELELTLVKSLLNAFYSKKGGYLLVEYHDPKCIEGLEDETRRGVVADSDVNDDGDDKSYHRRKQKSVAELLREDEPTIKKTKISNNGGSGKRKRKALVVSVTPESDHESGGGGGGVEEETMSPRQRKKSKYLSPPYLSPVGSGRLSVLGSGSFKEPKPEPEPEPEQEKVPEMAAKHLEDSSKKSSGRRTRQNKGLLECSDSQEEPKNTTRDAVNVNKVLHGLLRLARDPTEEKNLPAVTDLISSYRTSVFEEGSSHQTDRKKKTGGTSDLSFIKQKLESLIEMVQGCEETEMSADVKASLEGGIQEVLQKVGQMKGR